MDLEDLERLIGENANKIEKNANKIEKNIERIQQNSYALEILQDYKRTIKRLYVIVIMLVMAIIILGLHHLIGC